MSDIKLESQEDLFALLRKLPEKEKYMAMDIITRLQNGDIDHNQAADKIEKLLFGCGLAHRNTLM